MPTQVIVVKRSRRRFFAAPRALPDWLRSVWVARSRRSASETEVTGSRTDSPDQNDQARLHVPRLEFDANGAHHCGGCDLCVRVCPSRCLQMTAEGEGESLRVSLFGIESARCIGCGVCRDVCPENALEMSRRADVERVVEVGRSSMLDLLTIDG